jgi:uncharacterized protein
MADPTPQQRIETDLKTAMKAGEKERVGTLRMLLTDLKNERIRRGEEVDEAGFVAQVRKGIKQREESADQFDKGGRDDSAAKERREAEILSAYLPAGPSEAEIRSAVEAHVAEHGLSGMQAMGKVMPAMIQRFEGRADNAVLSRIVRDVLNPAGS